MDETGLYHYDPETKQQSVEWQHSGSTRPQKILRAKIRWKSSRLDFSGSRRHPPYLLASKGPNYQCGVLLISDGANVGHFEGHQGGSCSCMTMPLLTGHLQSRRNWPTWASNALITHTILRIWHRRTTICSLVWKKFERSPFFVRREGHCCRGDLVGRTTF